VSKANALKNRDIHPSFPPNRVNISLERSFSLDFIFYERTCLTFEINSALTNCCFFSGKSFPIFFSSHPTLLVDIPVLNYLAPYSKAQKTGIY
jgi:hypothetical protein